MTCEKDKCQKPGFSNITNDLGMLYLSGFMFEKDIKILYKSLFSKIQTHNNIIHGV